MKCPSIQRAALVEPLTIVAAWLTVLSSTAASQQGVWKNVTPTDMPDFGRVSLIDGSAFDAGKAYVSARLAAAGRLPAACVEDGGLRRDVDAGGCVREHGEGELPKEPGAGVSSAVEGDGEGAEEGILRAEWVGDGEAVSGECGEVC